MPVLSESAGPFAVSVNVGSSNEVTDPLGTIVLSAVGVYVRGEITQEEPAEWGPDAKVVIKGASRMRGQRLLPHLPFR